MKVKSKNKLRRLFYGRKPLIFTRENIQALNRLSSILNHLSGTLNKK